MVLLNATGHGHFHVVRKVILSLHAVKAQGM
jgi:hypothetical protein